MVQTPKDKPLEDLLREYIEENEHQGTHVDLVHGRMICWVAAKAVLEDFVMFIENYQ